jgi:hypothetical protein
MPPPKEQSFVHVMIPFHIFPSSDECTSESGVLYDSDLDQTRTGPPCISDSSVCVASRAQHSYQLCHGARVHSLLACQTLLRPKSQNQCHYKLSEEMITFADRKNRLPPHPTGISIWLYGRSSVLHRISFLCTFALVCPPSPASLRFAWIRILGSGLSGFKPSTVTMH